MKSFLTLVDIINKLKLELHKGITIINADEQEVFISYNSLFIQACRALHGLQQKGVERRQELILYVDGIEEFIHIFWSCLLGGIIPIPVATHHNEEHQKKLILIWEQLKNPVLLTNKKFFSALTQKSTLSKEFVEKISKKVVFLEEFKENLVLGKLQSVKPEDTALIQFSSGSTGNPKGILLTHENLCTNIGAIIRSAQINQEDSTLSWMPATHDMGLIGFHLVPMAAKINQFLMPTALFIRRPSLWLKKADEHKATLLSSPNFGYSYFMNAFKKGYTTPLDLSNVRLIFNGAEPISEKVCNEFTQRMKEYKLRENAIFPVYGLAEASLAVTFPIAGERYQGLYLSPEHMAIGQLIQEDKNRTSCQSYLDVGLALENCQVRVCDNEDNELQEKSIGHIQISGKNVTKGYYNNSTATQDAFTADGWFKTGDVGFIKNGRLFITGRVKDIVFVNGQNLYLNDIDKAAEGFEGIQPGSIAACRMYDEQSGKDRVVLFVAYKGGLSQFLPIVCGIKKLIYQKMGIMVDPVLPVRKIPKTTSGKVVRYSLGERYTSGEFNPVLEELKKLFLEQLNSKEVKYPSNSTESVILEMVRKITGYKNIGVDSNFFDLGLDSLLLAQLTDQIEKQYPGKVEITHCFEYPNIESLSGFIDTRNDTAPKAGKEESIHIDLSQIAIIGVAAKLPSAENADAYWQNIRSGINCITEFPDSRRTDVNEYLKHNGDKNGRTYLKGGFLQDVDRFDHAFFGIPSREAEVMNPNQRLFLESVWHLFEDAGYCIHSVRGRNIGIYVGYMGDFDGYQYGQMANKINQKTDAVSFVGNLPSVIPGRIAYLLNLKGPCMLLDTACSSSLVAIHQACQAIRNSECEMAIAGGVRINLLPLKQQGKIGIESDDGRTKAFDDRADGTGMGEGVVSILLKPLRKALEDKDNIYAVIKGSAVNQDGSSAGITAPNVKAQTEVIVKAWEAAKIEPETISYIEAHGTGTKLGDPIEIQGLQRAFEKYTDKKQFCGIGSVKNNIGHLLDTAGITGVLKLVLMLRHKEIPPLANFISPNQNIDFAKSPFYINTELRKWEASGHPRRGGISAFGFSGTNCHMVLEEAPCMAPVVKNNERRVNAFTATAQSEKAMITLLKAYQKAIAEDENADIDRICYTLNTGRTAFGYRLAMTVGDKTDLSEKLNRILENGIPDTDKDIFYSQFFESGPNSREKKHPTQLHNVLPATPERLETVRYLCRSFVEGEEIHWEEVYGKDTFNKVNLPLYPFEKRRCWITIPPSACLTIHPNKIITRNPITKDCVKALFHNGNEKVNTVVVNKLIAIFKRELGFEQIDIDADLSELGIDSIHLVNVFEEVNREFPGLISQTQLFAYSSIAELSEFIASVMTDCSEENAEKSERSNRNDLETVLDDIFMRMENGNISIEDAAESICHLQ